LPIANIEFETNFQRFGKVAFTRRQRGPFSRSAKTVSLRAKLASTRKQSIMHEKVSKLFRLRFLRMKFKLGGMKAHLINVCRFIGAEKHTPNC
jgi:hypothetical protein